MIEPYLTAAQADQNFVAVKDDPRAPWLQAN